MRLKIITIFICLFSIGTAGQTEVYASLSDYIPTNQQASCFPADTQIISKSRGVISMDDLNIGDEILTTTIECSDCEHVYTKVTGWLHRDPQYSTLYLQIFNTNGESFFVSPKHNLALEDGQYAFAKDLLGSKLFGNKESVQKIFAKERKGVYAPMTDAGNYFILNSNEKKVLAHCFANVVNPNAYESIVKMLMKTYDNIMGVSHQKMHPVASWLMKNAGFLMQK